jgi:hypothetical protein
MGAVAAPTTTRAARAKVQIDRYLPKARIAPSLLADATRTKYPMTTKIVVGIRTAKRAIVVSFRDADF